MSCFKGESYSAFDQPQPQIKVYIKKSRKRKKHRRRSSSSSIEDESVPVVSGKHKKRKRRKYESDSGSQTDENVTSNRFTQSSETVHFIHIFLIFYSKFQPFDSSCNPWRLLRRKEYNYVSDHLVVDRHSDRDNLKYEQPYRSEVAEYRGIFPMNASLNEIRAVSETFASLLNKSTEFLASKDEKSYAERHIVDWNILPVERLFRRNNDCSFSDFVVLSHQPRGNNDEGVISFKIFYYFTLGFC
jgi:hypothetical protein